MNPLTKEEAKQLMEWKDLCFKLALDAVIARSNPAWAPYSKHIIPAPRQNGKPGIVFNVLVESAINYMNENMTETEIQHYVIAQDYEEILLKDEEDGGGFDSMSEAYAAGVPIEDIVA